MFEAIAWDQVGIVGLPWVLLSMVFLMNFRGQLVPKWFFDAVVKDRKEALEASQLKDQQIAELVKQVGYMAEVGKTMQAILTAIQRTGGRSVRDDEEMSS